MDTSRHGTINILMLPWLAHGHISPFLELAKKLTKRNFNIHLCSTPINLTSIKKRITKKYSASIQLVELHLPSLPELPPRYHTTNGLPPHLMPTLKTAFENSSHTFNLIVKTLKPNLLIYDFNQPWAAAIASSHNIPAVLFLSFGATMSAFGIHMFKKIGQEYPFPEIFLHEHESIKFRETLDSSINDVKDGDRFLQSVERSCDMVLIKTFREFEDKYIDYLSVLAQKMIVPVGSLVQDSVNDEEDMEIIQWLDKKEETSVVFVSFGSEYFLSKDEMEEIAHGIELSKVGFIWVVRFPVGEKTRVEEALPQGFLERVGERGRVVEGWAPQRRILGHSSTGGFVSHCGWSSIMESIKVGVPIIAMPMHIDQPINARLVEEVGVGVEVVRDNNGKLHRKEIAEVIRNVVVEKSGEGIRRKVRDLSEKLRINGEEEMDGVAEELVKLCRKRN